MRTRTPEIDSRIIELYQVRGQLLATVAEAVGWSRGTTYRRIRELGIQRDKATINKMRSESLMGHIGCKTQLGKPLPDKTKIKISNSLKGNIPWNKGKQMPPGTGEKVAAKLRGRPSWNKGIPMHEWMTEESNTIRKVKITENNPRYWLGKKRPELYADPAAREKQAELTALSWQDPNIREKRIRNALKASFVRPTKPEQRIIDVTQKYNLPYAYTGDGSTIICGLNPDFVNYNGAKKVIEVFGVVFHDPDRAIRREPRLSSQGKYRKAIYASLGFDCLILWDDEIKKLSDEEIAGKIKKFTKSRHKATPQLRFKEVM